MRHHTKDKGDIGVGYVIADLLSKGVQVCIPLSEHLPFDLIGVKPNGTLIRVSVKYRKLSKGALNIHFKSTYSDSKGAYAKKTNKSLIDIMAIYCPDTKMVYYINPSEYRESINLRVDKPKNNQTKNILFAENYLEL